MKLPAHTKIFLEYFERRFWTNRAGSSGPNSDLSRTQDLCAGINQLLKDYHITSMVDAGCGDANLMRAIDLEGIAYLGLDCVPAMIEINKAVFAVHDSMFFDVADVVTMPLPQADLILCRDVVHYLPNALVQQFLDNVIASDSRYLLITHNTQAPYSANTETEVGIFRPINITQAPFNWLEPVAIVDDTDPGKTMGLFEIANAAPR